MPLGVLGTGRPNPCYPPEIPKSHFFRARTRNFPMLKPANKRLSNTGIGATRPRMRDASGGFVRGRARALTGPLPRRSLSAQPRTTRDEAAGHGRAAAVEAALASAGRVDAVSVAVGAARIAVGGEATCDEPADSAEHDVAAGTGRWERWGACGEGARALEALARMTPFFDEAIDAFPESSAPGRPKVMAGVIARGRGGEVEASARGPLRRARSPQARPFPRCDPSQVSSPEGHTADDLMPLGSVGRARDLVLHGKVFWPAGARPTWPSRLAPLAPGAGCELGSSRRRGSCRRP